MAAGRQRNHRRQVVVAAILITAGRDTDHIRRQIAEHRFHIVKRWHIMQTGRFIRPLVDDVADANQLSQLILHVKFRVPIADGAQSDDRYP